MKLQVCIDLGSGAVRYPFHSRPASGTWRLAALVLACTVMPWTAADGLLNGDFEQQAFELPQHWKVYVAPAPGASGQRSSEAHGGQYSVMLHTPTPYEREPVNNWSQTVTEGLAGKQVRVAGWLKTEAAQEAALWLQCWRRQPWGVVKTFTTSTDQPVYGTRDWEAVSMTAAVPEGADFVVVRCVLLGTGTAWFDDVSLEVIAAEPESTPPAGPAAHDPAAAPVAAPVDQASPSAASGPGQALAQLETEIGRLREANLIMAEALQQVREDNAVLLEELIQLRESLAAVEARASAGVEAAAPAKKVPPLVPHGFDWRTLE